MDIIVYYRSRPSESAYSDIALQEQRETVKRWVEEHQATLKAEYVEPETEGFSRPQLREAMDICKRTGATLLIARTEAIGRGAQFSPRITSVAVAFAPEPLRDHGYVIPAPAKAPAGLTLYFPDFRSLRIMPVYLCNRAGEPIRNIIVRTAGITSKLTMPRPTTVDGQGSASEQPLSTTPTAFSLDQLGARFATVIDRYDPMFDSDFITGFEVAFLDQHNQKQLAKAFIGPTPLSSAFVALKT
jgi:hypothetical protein